MVPVIDGNIKSWLHHAKCRKIPLILGFDTPSFFFYAFIMAMLSFVFFFPYLCRRNKKQQHAFQMEVRPINT